MDVVRLLKFSHTALPLGENVLDKNIKGGLNNDLRYFLQVQRFFWTSLGANQYDNPFRMEMKNYIKYRIMIGLTRISG